MLCCTRTVVDGIPRLYFMTAEAREYRNEKNASALDEVQNVPFFLRIPLQRPTLRINLCK